MTSNSFSFVQDPAWGTGTFVVNVVVSDSNTPTNTVVTDNGTTYNVVAPIIPIPPLTFNSLTISNMTIQTGQAQNLTASVYNGVSPYIYDIMVYNSVGLVANQVAMNPMTSNSFIFVQDPAWGTGTFVVNVVVSDSNTPTNTVVTDNGATYNVIAPIIPIPPLTFNSLTISNMTIQTGQTQNLTASVYNGVSPYIYDIMVYNSVGLVANQMAMNPMTSNSFIFVQDPAWGTGTFVVNVVVSDRTPLQTQW